MRSDTFDYEWKYTASDTYQYGKYHDGDTFRFPDSWVSVDSYGMGSDCMFWDYGPSDRINSFQPMFSSLYKVFGLLSIRILWMICLFMTIYIWYFYSAIDYVAANNASYFYAYFDTFLSWGVILFFPLIVSGIVYKSLIFWARHQNIKTSGWLGILGGVFWIFITGASCCGVTLISVLGMTSVIGFLEIFPYHGLEIKTLGLIVLIYTCWDLYKNIDVCKISTNTPSRRKN